MKTASRYEPFSSRSQAWDAWAMVASGDALQMDEEEDGTTIVSKNQATPELLRAIHEVNNYWALITIS